MGAANSTNTNQEQSGCEGTVEVVPPYHNDVESFDNPDKFPDLEFVVGGMEKPLQLHRRILAESSVKIRTMLNERRDLKLEWPFDTTKEVEREALVKALRFCYGETQTVGTKNGECIAMIVALARLQVTFLDDAVTLLSNFAIDEAKRNVEIGVELLKACVGYKEMSDTNQLTLDKKLAAIVLTKDNMQEHFKEVVDECLMVLPPEYLTFAEFGEPHTRLSEFCLRTRYVRSHSKELTKEQRQAMVAKCDFSILNSQELRELRLADIIDKDELLEAHEKALEYREIENEQATEMSRKVERKMEEKVNQIGKERDEMRKRAEEMRRRAEDAEKDKEEKVKQAEMERDRSAKEAEECKKRTEEAVKEREEESKRARTAEAERDDMRRRANSAEKDKAEKVKQAETERDEKVKAAGIERDKFAKEAEECKRRAEIAEREREELRRRAEIAEKEKVEKVKQAEMERDEKVRLASKDRDERVKAAEVERDKFRKEAEEWKKSSEAAEKEKEKIKQAEIEKDKKLKAGEIERDKCTREAQEYKRRAEIAENGRKEENKRATKAEAEREESRKRAETAEKEKEERVKETKAWMALAKKVEKERDEYKRCAERVEQEKGDLCKCIEAFEYSLKGKSLLQHDTEMKKSQHGVLDD